MAIDSKGNNHQPKGTPNAGRFAPKAGAGDDDDLYEPRHPVGAAGTAWAAGSVFCRTTAFGGGHTCTTARIAWARTTATWPHSDGP